MYNQNKALFPVFLKHWGFLIFLCISPLQYGILILIIVCGFGARADIPERPCVNYFLERK